MMNFWRKKYLRVLKKIGALFLVFMGVGCATYRPQFEKDSLIRSVEIDKEVAHTFYIAGGLGNAETWDDHPMLEALDKELETAGKHSTLLFVGDHLSTEKGNWEQDRDLLAKQLAISKGFKGNTYFLPGNNEWKEKDMDSIQRVEEFLDQFEDGEDLVLPKNGCPLEYRTINKDLDLLFIDSKWFISNWSRVTGINQKCTDIITRRRFAEELEGYINDAQDKNLVIAMHHPIFSNGAYAGYQTFKDHLLPVPVLGTILHGIEDLGAFAPDLLLARRYNYLRILVSSLAKKNNRVTILSGHEQNLQYLSGGGIHQIISGALGEVSATKRTKDYINAIGGSLTYKGIYTNGTKGFAKLEYYGDGSSKVTFTTPEGTHSFDVLQPLRADSDGGGYPDVLADVQYKAVYRPEELLERTGFFKYLWGYRYRNYYGIPVKAQVVSLDTLYGGLKVVKKGGGHQSYSLRLEDRDKKQYAMRSLRKNPLKFLKYSVQGVAYTEEEYEDTVPEELVSDFFTTAHPYMQLVINPMARAVDVNHANPRLFYVPKQEGLGSLNPQFGDQLYFIEQRPSDEQYNYKGYRRTIDESGKVTDFESTTDMLEKIKSDESYTVDQQAYARARIFDMLLGDWDRHQDQWRWVEYEKPNGTKEFMPVPRDRDNAFPKFDGQALNVIQWFIPITRQWQSYGPKIKSLKWLSYNGGRLDQTLLPNFTAMDWEREARYIQRNLTDSVIDLAFQRLPLEVQDSTSQSIQQNLKIRLADLHKYAKAYGEYLNRRVILHATEKDDEIQILRLPGGGTQVIMRRLFTDRPNEVFYERLFDPEETRELWIYGLGDDDRFLVSGTGKSKIFIRLIGGFGEDRFEISNTKALKVYDWGYEPTLFPNERPSKQFTDLYRTNTFHWRHFKPSRNILVPTTGFRTDDGLFLGVKNTFIRHGFNGNPFRQKHMFHAKYHFQFQASELSYKGVFANIFPKWNFELDGYGTSERYANNFFGFGNATANNEDTVGRDFYRARTEQWKLGAGIAYHTLRIRALYEAFRLSETENRLFTAENLGGTIFERQQYVGMETSLYYYNDDADDFPTKGLYFGLTTGYKANLSRADNQFGYVAFTTEVARKIIPSGDLVLGTTAEYKTNFGGDYFLYHAPSIGGSNGLRGFRDERFTGNSYFYQSSDLRWRIKRYITPLAPVTFGIYGGFDYGRVWQPGERSRRWHTSQGVGLWASLGNYLAFNAGFFNSVEDTMVQVGFGFGF